MPPSTASSAKECRTGLRGRGRRRIALRGTELSAVVASRRRARCYRVSATGSRTVEMRLATRYLGDARSAGTLARPGTHARRLMRILTLGGHDFTRRGPDRALRDYMLGLLGRRHPRVCLLPTASGDPADQISRFHDSFGARRVRGLGPLALPPRRGGRSPCATTCSPRT